MYPVSDRFLIATRNPGTPVTVADLYSGGTLIRSDIPVVSGSVEADENSNVRRSGSIDMISDIEDLINRDILQYEVVVRTGFQYALGLQEFVPLGTFMIWSANVDFGAGGVISLELYDRSKHLDSAIPRFYDASGKPAQTALQELVTAGMPTATTVSFATGLQNPRLPGGTTYDNTYLDAILDICDTIGAEFFFTLSGTAVVQAKPSVTVAPTMDDVSYTYTTGDTGNLVEIGRQITRDQIYNGVGVYGATPSETVPQVFAEAYDLNPASKTYWNGSFGRRFLRIDRAELTTPAQCYEAAQAELAKGISFVQPAQFQGLPNPALDIADIIQVVYTEDLAELHSISSFSLDLANWSMNIDTQGRGIVA